MRVRWLRTALRNLDGIAARIAGDNPAAAERTIRRVREAVDRLVAHPAIGRPGRVAGTRELVVPGTPYVVPYRVRGNSIEILRVLHGAQQWPPGRRR